MRYFFSLYASLSETESCLYAQAYQIDKGDSYMPLQLKASRATLLSVLFSVYTQKHIKEMLFRCISCVVLLVPPPPPALTFVSAASAPACFTTYAITAQSLTGELKWIAAGRIATDESRSAADSLAVGSVPQDSATGTRSEESTAAISTHLYEF